MDKHTVDVLYISMRVFETQSQIISRREVKNLSGFIKKSLDSESR